MQKRLAVILAADVVGYSAMMEQDEVGTFARIVSLRKEVLEPLMGQRRGRIFKLNRDGILAEFDSALDAVECAVAIQNELAGTVKGTFLMPGSDLPTLPRWQNVPRSGTSKPARRSSAWQ